MMYGSWDMKCDRQNSLSFFIIFCPFTPNSPKIKILKKWKKVPGDIIILHMCAKNYDQMMYGFWDMVCDRCNCYFSFWDIFCLFTPQTTQKIKILKKLKKSPRDIIILKICTKNYDQMMYGSWDMMHDGCNYFSVWAIFCPFTPLTTQKIKILKKWIPCLEISSFYIRVPKIMIRWCTVPEIWCVTDGRTDRQKEWHIEVGAPPNKKLT